MAKVTKALLKSLVKECLVEILIEGIDSEDGENQLIESIDRKKPAKKKTPKVDPMIEIQKRRDKLDSVRVNEAVQNITDDPIMASIFRDTAQTTLQEQTAGEKRGNFVPSDAAAKVAFDNDPLDIFDGANNWAALAFSDKKPG